MGILHCRISPHSSRQKLLFCDLVAVFASVIVAPSIAQAYPVSFTVTGTFGAVISGSDPLKLSGSPFSMTGAINSGAPKPYVIPSLMLTLGSGSGSITVTLTNVPLSLTPGNPAQVTISASVVGQPFTAVVNLSPGFTVSYPYPFGTQPIASGSTVNYGAAPGTTLAISGSVAATSTAPSLSFGPPSFTYAFTIGGSVPPSQNLTVTSSGAAASFDGSSPDAWVVIPSGSHSTGTPVAISVDPTKITGIAAGTYNSTITLNSTTGVLPQNSTIPVSLVVTIGLPTITPSPASLTFNYQLLQSPPAAQTVTLNGGAGLSYTTSGAPSWLTVSASGTTPGPVNVSLNTAGLTAGTLNGSFNINLAGAANATINIPVTANITAAPTLSSPTSSLTFSYQIGNVPPTAQSVTVNGSGGATIPFTASTSVTTPPGGTWLSAGAGGTTGGSVSVAVTPGTLTAGTYTGSVTISSTQASNSVVIPVTLTVTSLTMTVDPPSLAFLFQLHGTEPGSQLLTLSAPSSVPISFSAASADSWLSVAPTTGSTGPPSATLTISVDTTKISKLSAITYNSKITITSSQVTNSPLVVPVSLTVSGKLATLHSFTGTSPEGAVPKSSLTEVSSGVFWGSTFGSANQSQGATLFTVHSGTGTIATLHNFSANLDGTNPGGRLLAANNGLLYGVNMNGGAGNIGTIFTSDLHGNVSVANAAVPVPLSLIEATDQNLYGVTFNPSGNPSNVFFKMTQAGLVTVLHTFTAAEGVPSGPLIQAANGNFYGETMLGASSFGTVYQMTTTGVLTLVYAFTNGPDGGNPVGGLVQATNGHLYGVALGGAGGAGVIFGLTPGFTTLHSFFVTDGEQPSGGLIQATDRNLYGVTQLGGQNNSGTIFRISLTGAFTSVHDFSGSDGAQPQTQSQALTQGSDGKLYGTTSSGGTTGNGTAYSLDLGLSKPKPVISTFSPAAGPTGTLVLITGQNLLAVKSVTFNGTAATFSSRGSSYVYALVPTGATSGPIVVTTPNGTVISRTNFIVQ